MKKTLTQFGLLRIQGPDAQTFLQGQLTCDIRKITGDISILGAYLNQKGRIIATMRVFLWQECYWLQAPKEVLPLLQKSLQHFAVFSKVKIEDVSEHFNIFATQNNPTPNSEIKINQIAEHRFEIIAPNSFEITDETVDEKIWLRLDIESGIPTIFAATQQQFLPQPIHYDTLGVSFDKGCYMGQEIVARMHYRGTKKQHLYRVEMDANHSPTIGAPIIAASNNREIGELVMFVQDNQSLIALATLSDEFAIDQAIHIEEKPFSLKILERY